MKTHNNFSFIDTNYLYNVSENNDFLKKKEKNFEDLSELVHKAKSSISILGMIKQAESMKSLETDIRNFENSETYEERINQFISDCKNAVSEIEILEKSLS